MCKNVRITRLVHYLLALRKACSYIVMKLNKLGLKQLFWGAEVK